MDTAPTTIFQSELGAEIPGGVYLCQVAKDISCAACCGLYNMMDVRLEILLDMLQHRTAIFAGVSRTVEAILEFKAMMEAKEIQDRPYPEFHHCPFIGMIGIRRTRVGCLLHPMGEGNNGVDLRGLSYYGGMACRSYFCPSCERLPESYKQIVRGIVTDWYTYGLVITDTDLILSFFNHVEDVLGKSLRAETVLTCPRCRKFITEFFSLKIQWPFRPAHCPSPANYFFNDHLYPRPRIDYAAVGMPASIYDAIFRAMGTEFNTRAEVEAAEGCIGRLVHGAADCLS